MCVSVHSPLGHQAHHLLAGFLFAVGRGTPRWNIHTVGTNTSIVWMGCSTRVSKSTTLSLLSVMKFDIDYLRGYVCCIIMFQWIGEHTTDSAVPLRSHRSSTSNRIVEVTVYGNNSTIHPDSTEDGGRSSDSVSNSRGWRPCGDTATGANVPEGENIDVLIQGTLLYEVRVYCYHVF